MTTATDAVAVEGTDLGVRTTQQQLERVESKLRDYHSLAIGGASGSIVRAAYSDFNEALTNLRKRLGDA